MLLYKGRCYILDDIDLKNMIFHDNHDSNIAGHLAIYKALERIKNNFHWHRIEEDVRTMFGLMTHVNKTSLVAIPDMDSCSH